MAVFIRGCAGNCRCVSISEWLCLLTGVHVSVTISVSVCLCDDGEATKEGRVQILRPSVLDGFPDIYHILLVLVL